jgi:pimeloyl-ACP methyl ester carboxylesterase
MRPSAALPALLIAVSLTAPAPAMAQADYTREKRWADEITPSIVVGDPVYLKLKSGRTFLAIWTPNSKARAGVILVHGVGVHPDWGLINTLRSQLAERGYATLSVQMPVLAADARGDQYAPLYPEAAERLSTAVDFLRDKGLGKTAIVSHSMGSRMTNYYVEHAPDPRLAAWVAIGLSGEYTGLERFRAPVLDLYGEHDLPGVLASAKQRAAEIRGIRGSGQAQVPGADHFFANHENDLVRQVELFLSSKLR